jgi:hypothetical protein
MDANGASALLAPLWEKSEGIWLVTTPDAQRIDPQAAVRAWLEGSAVASLRWDFGENALAFFARTPARAGTLYDLGPQAATPANAPIELSSTATLAGAWMPLPRYAAGDALRLALLWARPPLSEEIVIEVAGPVTQDFAVPPPSRATTGPTRQLFNLPLSPGWPGGDYRLSVRAANGRRFEIGRFTLLNRRALDTATLADIASPFEVRFGPSIRLLGYSLPQARAEPGGVVELTLYWQTEAALGARYKIFTHLVGEEYNASLGNFLWGQQDNEPQGGMTPTTAWPPGVIIADNYAIPVSPDAPPGRYTLEAGLYGLVDGARLPVLNANDQPQGDAVTLAQVEVIAKAP